MYVEKDVLFYSFVGCYLIMGKSLLGKRNWVSLDLILCEIVCEIEMYKLSFLIDLENKFRLYLNDIFMKFYIFWFIVV